MGSSWADCNQKNLHSEVLSSLAVCNNNKPFLNWMWCETKWTVYNNQQWPAQGLDQEEAPKHFPKPNLHQKRSWSLFGGLLPVWSTTSESQQNHYIWEVCSANRDAPKTSAPAAVNRKGPVLLHNNAWPHVARPTLQKLNELGLIRHIHLTSHQLTTTSSSISTTSCMENLSTSRRRQKIFSKSLSNPEAWIFTLLE